MSDPKRGRTTAASTRGSFAPHERSEGEVQLSRPPLEASGELEFFILNDRRVSRQVIRQQLNLDDETLDRLIELTADIPGTPKRIVIPAYADPGDGASLDTSQWRSPGERTVWGAYALARRNHDRYTVTGTLDVSVPDVDTDGYSQAIQSMVRWNAPAGARLDADAFDGKVSVRIAYDFDANSFTPESVESAMHTSAAYMNLEATIPSLFVEGKACRDDDLEEAVTLSPTDIAAAAAAASFGRRPTDAEIIAIARESRAESPDRRPLLLRSSLHQLSQGFVSSRRQARSGFQSMPPGPERDAVFAWVGED